MNVDALLHFATEPLLALTVRASLLMLVALGAALLFRRTRAASRHAIFATLFVTLLLLPWAPRVAPRIDLRVSAPSRSATSNAKILAPKSDTPAPLAAASESRSWSVTWRDIYVAGVALILASLIRGVVRLRRFAAQGTVWLDGTRLATEVACSSAIRRAVLVVLSDDVSMPMTFGFRRSTILMPFAAEQWDDESLRRALRHELEHVRREDWLSQLLARTACALYWPHPLAWISLRRFCVEAERSCDDAVLRSFDASRYAEQLVGLARSVRHRTIPALAMAAPTRLGERIHAILDPAQQRGPHGRVATATTALFMMSALVASGPIHLVAAESKRPAANSRNDAVVDGVSGGIADGTEDGVEGALAGFHDEIIQAAADGDLERLQLFLDRGIDVNATIDGDGTPLLISARNGRVDAVRFLLDHDADPNVASPGDGNPLIAAAGENQTAVVRLLLQRGARIDDVVDGDENALITAARRGAADAVRLLIDSGANVNARVWVEHSDDGAEWRTALKMARRGRHHQIEQMLLAAGARE